MTQILIARCEKVNVKEKYQFLSYNGLWGGVIEEVRARVRSHVFERPPEKNADFHVKNRVTCDLSSNDRAFCVKKMFLIFSVRNS